MQAALTRSAEPTRPSLPSSNYRNRRCHIALGGDLRNGVAHVDTLGRKRRIYRLSFGRSCLNSVRDFSVMGLLLPWQGYYELAR